MKNTYLLIAIIGFIAPNILVAMVSIETGNILLWLHPSETVVGMFQNKISSAFIIDLLVVVMIFFTWSYQESKKHKIKNWWLIVVLTMMFGMAGSYPLFLYLKEKNKK